MRSLLNLFSILLLLNLPPQTVRAESGTMASLSDPVTGAPGMTYFELARRFVPDLQPDGMAWTGHTLDETYAQDWELETEWPDGIGMDGVETVAFERDGKQRLAILFGLAPATDTAETPTILALYALEDTPRLIDAIDVGLDRDNGFAEPAIQTLSDGAALIATESSHWNSSQSYRITNLVLAEADKLTTVDEVLTLSERYCRLNRTQTPAIAVEPGASGKRAAIHVSVRVTEEKVDEACDEPPPAPAPERLVSVTYRWNDQTGTYMPDSQALEALAKENEERF